MRQIRLALLPLVLSILLPSVVHAQDVLGFSFGGGLTLARGGAAETHGRGINLGFKTTAPLSERLTVLATIGYQDIRLDDDAEARRRGHDPEIFRLGGGFIDGGHRRVLGVLVEGQLHLLPRSSRLSPYVVAGAGVSQLRVPDTDVYFLNEWETDPGSNEVAPMAEVGAGLQLRLSQAVALFAQGSYLTVFADETTTMIPLHVGLLIEMGP